jgi:hypothetical protein
VKESTYSKHGDVVDGRDVINEEEVGLDDEDIVGTEDELDANEEAENMNFEEGFREFEVQEGENVDFKKRVSGRLFSLFWQFEFMVKGIDFEIIVICDQDVVVDGESFE